MPARSLPGLGLTGFWDLGFEPWKDGMDANLLLLSVVGNGCVISATTDPLPGSPPLGDIYIVASGADANKVAVRDLVSGVADWVFFTPRAGWTFYVEDAGTTLRYDGTSWLPPSLASRQTLTATASRDFSSSDAENFVDYNSGSAGSLTVPADDSGFPVSTIIGGAQVGAGALTIAVAAGVLLNGVDGGSATLTGQWSEYSLRKRAAGVWVLSGDHGGVS